MSDVRRSQSPEQGRLSSPSRGITSFTRHFAEQADGKEAEEFLPGQSIPLAGILPPRSLGETWSQEEKDYAWALRRQEPLPDAPAFDTQLISSSAGTVMEGSTASTPKSRVDVADSSSDDVPLAQIVPLKRRMNTVPDTSPSDKKGKSSATAERIEQSQREPEEGASDQWKVEDYSGTIGDLRTVQAIIKSDFEFLIRRKKNDAKQKLITLKNMLPDAKDQKILGKKMANENDFVRAWDEHAQGNDEVMKDRMQELIKETSSAMEVGRKLNY